MVNKVKHEGISARICTPHTGTVVNKVKHEDISARFCTSTLQQKVPTNNVKHEEDLLEVVPLRRDADKRLIKGSDKIRDPCQVW